MRPGRPRRIWEPESLRRNARCRFSALASGLPAVSTRFIGWGEELGEPGRHYLLAEREARPLADALAEILDKPAVRDRLSAEGVRWVRKSMKLDTTLDRFAALYRDLAG